MSSKIPLLLLPGLLCDSAFWRAQKHALRDICDIAIPSYGLLDSIGAMAQSVLAGAPPVFALAGHSMGGRVAQEIYARAPDRVLKLALLCTDYRAPENKMDRRIEAGEREAMLTSAQVHGMKTFARDWARQLVAPGRIADAQLIEPISNMFARNSLDVLAAQTHAGLTRPNFTDLLARIACPTLICAGEQDNLRPPASHREMAAQIARSRLETVPDCGHMLAMEQPAAVTAMLRSWIAA